MKKAELLDRISNRALSRYGQSLPETLFDDLVDDGLIPEGDRQGNDGKRPIYNFGCASYRRALQIVRLRSRGLVNRNALRVNFFLRGYSLPVWDVREALCREYADFAKSISHQVRSGYADNWKAVPPKHKRALVEKFGEPDVRFQTAGLEFSGDQLIEVIRAARQQPIVAGSGLDQNQMLRWIASQPTFQQTIPALLDIIAGTLMSDPERGGNPGQIRDLVDSLDDDFFIRARRLYRALTRDRCRILWHFMKNEAAFGDQLNAGNAAAVAISDQPGFAALAFVQCLRLLRDFPILARELSTDADCDKVLILLDKLYGEKPGNWKRRLG